MIGVSEHATIALNNHRALPIRHLRNYVNTNTDVLTYAGVENDKKEIETGITNTPFESISAPKLAECVELTLADGRTLICSYDQEIMLTTGEWKRADDFIVDVDEVFVGPQLPTFIGDEDDRMEEKDWSFTVDDFTFRTDTIVNLEKTLAFVRVLGYFLADGNLFQDKRCDSIAASVAMGCVIDAWSMIDDVKKAFGFLLHLPNRINGMYAVNLSPKIGKIFSHIDGVSVGPRMDQDSNVPPFIMTAPRIVIAQFLNGLLGGDGLTVSSLHSKTNKFHLTYWIGFCFSKSNKQHENALVYRQELVSLLSKFDMKIIKRKPNVYSTLNNTDNRSYLIKIPTESFLQFVKNIGFAHCVSKSIRLTAASALYHYNEMVKVQDYQLTKLFDKYCEYSRVIQEADDLGYEDHVKGHYVQTNLKMSGTQARLNAIETYKKKNPLFGKIISKNSIVLSIRYGKIPVTNIDGKNILKSWGSYYWFRTENTEVKKGPAGKKITKITYANPQDKLTTPCMTMKVVYKRYVGLKLIYTLTVPITESYLANGIVVRSL